MSVFLQPIYTQTLNANASSITFNNIPQGFTDLKIVVSGRSTEATLWDNLFWVFNSNTGNNYSANQASGYPTNAPSADRLFGHINSGFYPHLPTTSATANLFSNTEIYIPNYSSGKAKSWLCTSVSERNASTTTNYTPELLQAAGVFTSTSPITSITFYCYAQLAQYTTITIYGVSTVYDTGSPTAPTIGTVTDLGGIASVAFTANDSGQGRTADNYSVYDPTIMSAPVYAQTSPVIVPVSLGVTYNNLAVSANNAIGSNTSANPAGFTSFNNYAAIASLTLPSAGVLTLSNIPQYYRHLQVRIVARGNGAGAATGNFTLSGNSSGVYGWGYHSMRGNGSSVSAFNGGGAGYQSLQLPVFPSTSQTTNNFGICVIDILDYTDTAKFKTVRMFGGYDDNGSGVTEIAGGYFGSFEPVTSIIFAWANSPFTYATNTTMSIYGIS